MATSIEARCEFGGMEAAAQRWALGSAATRLSARGSISPESRSPSIMRNCEYLESIQQFKVHDVIGEAAHRHPANGLILDAGHWRVSSRVAIDSLEAGVN